MVEVQDFEIFHISLTDMVLPSCYCAIVRLFYLLQDTSISYNSFVVPDVFTFLSFSELWMYGSGLLECIQGKRSFSSLLEKQSVNSVNQVSLYSKTCLKWSLKKDPKICWLLNAGQKYCRMLWWSILQYF